MGGREREHESHSRRSLASLTRHALLSRNCYCKSALGREDADVSKRARDAAAAEASQEENGKFCEGSLDSREQDGRSRLLHSKPREREREIETSCHMEQSRAAFSVSRQPCMPFIVLVVVVAVVARSLASGWTRHLLRFSLSREREREADSLCELPLFFPDLIFLI